MINLPIQIRVKGLQGVLLSTIALHNSATTGSKSMDEKVNFAIKIRVRGLRFSEACRPVQHTKMKTKVAPNYVIKHVNP